MAEIDTEPDPDSELKIWHPLMSFWFLSF